jgi:micrococcal nuclease
MRLLSAIVLWSVIGIAAIAQVRITRVIDGDTFETSDGQVVRMIGINAPEISDISGTEAKVHLEKLIHGQLVILNTDSRNRDKDRYGRCLRYVDLGGKDINLTMIADGYATAYLKYRFERSEEYRSAQLDAAKGHLGMWVGDQSKSEQITDVSSIASSNWTKRYMILGLVGALILVLAYSRMRR